MKLKWIKNKEQRKNKKGSGKIGKRYNRKYISIKIWRTGRKNNKKNKNKFSRINEIEIKDLKTKKQIEEQIKNIEENNNIKNAIIKEEMYKQGLKDGINLIILCQNQ